MDVVESPLEASTEEVTVSEVCETVLQELENMRKALTCSLCLSTYTDAVLLPQCNHSYCRECLLHALQLAQRCPQCQQKAQRRSLVDAPLLNRLVRTYKQTARAFGRAPITYQASMALTQLPDSSSDAHTSMAHIHQHLQVAQTFGKVLAQNPDRALWYHEQQQVIQANQRHLLETALKQKPPDPSQLAQEAREQYAADAELDDFYSVEGGGGDVPVAEVATATRPAVEADQTPRVDNKRAIEDGYDSDITTDEIPVASDDRSLDSEATTDELPPRVSFSNKTEMIVPKQVQVSPREVNQPITANNASELSPVAENDEFVDPDDLFDNKDEASKDARRLSEKEHDAESTTPPVADPKMLAQLDATNEDAEVTANDDSVDGAMEDEATEPSEAKASPSDDDIDEKENVATRSSRFSFDRLTTPPSKSPTKPPSSHKSLRIDTTPSRRSLEFSVGDLVYVSARTWPGINKPGGMGRVAQVHAYGAYDINYVLGGRERRVDASFVSPPDEGELGRSSASRSKRIATKKEEEIPGSLLKKLAAEGFDTGAPVVTAKRKRPTRKAVPAEEPPTKKARSALSCVECLVPGRSQGAVKEAFDVSQLSEEELCANADAFYSKRLQKAVQKGQIHIVASSLSESETKKLRKLCKDSKTRGRSKGHCAGDMTTRSHFFVDVQVKLSEKFNPKTTTLCLLPCNRQSQGKTNAVGRVRTLKAMRATLAGVPIVSSTWLSSLDDEFVLPSSSAFIRSLPLKSHGVTGADFGVARTAAGMLRFGKNTGVLVGYSIYICGGSLSRQSEIDTSVLIRESGAELLSNPLSATKSIQADDNEECVVLLTNDTIDSGITPALDEAIRSNPGQVLVVTSQWLFDSISCGFPVPDIEAYKPPNPQAQDLWEMTKAVGDDVTPRTCASAKSHCEVDLS